MLTFFRAEPPDEVVVVNTGIDSSSDLCTYDAHLSTMWGMPPLLHNCPSAGMDERAIDPAIGRLREASPGWRSGTGTARSTGGLFHEDGVSAGGRGGGVVGLFGGRRSDEEGEG